MVDPTLPGVQLLHEQVRAVETIQCDGTLAEDDERLSDLASGLFDLQTIRGGEENKRMHSSARTSGGSLCVGENKGSVRSAFQSKTMQNIYTIQSKSMH